MADKRLSLKSCCFPYVVVLTVLWVLLRSFSMGFSLLAGDFLSALGLIALSFAVDFFYSGNRRTGMLMVVGAIFLYFGGSESLCFLNEEASVRMNLVASLALSFPLILVFPLLWKMGEHRISLILFFLAAAITVIISTSEYVYSYTYLYMDVADIVSHTKWFLLLVRLSVFAAALEFGMKSKRNFLVYAFFGMNFFVSLYESLLRSNLAASLEDCGKMLISTWLPVSFLVLLIIYIKGETPEKRVYERRNIVFSNMVYQELKPIKKRKKSPKFEVPPNVPTMKRNKDDGEN